MPLDFDARLAISTAEIAVRQSLDPAAAHLRMATCAWSGSRLSELVLPCYAADAKSPVLLMTLKKHEKFIIPHIKLTTCVQYLDHGYRQCFGQRDGEATLDEWQDEGH